MSRDKIKKVKKKFFSVINHTWDFLGHPCMPLKIDRIFSTSTPSTTRAQLTGLASYTMTLSWKANEQWTMESWGEPRGHRGSILCSLAN